MPDSVGLAAAPGLQARLAVGLLAAAIAVAGCADQAVVTTRPSPAPGAPTLRSPMWQFDSQVWTFSVIVDPNGDGTTVTFDWGVNGAFDHVILISAGVFETGRVRATSRTPSPDIHFCGRYRAANAFGVAILDAGCFPSLPPASP